MDMKSVLVKFIGGFVFSYGLVWALLDTGGYFVLAQMGVYQGGFRGIPTPLPDFAFEVFTMAIGLVLLVTDFSGCCKPMPKAKK